MCTYKQGSKKVPSSRLGQVDFPAGQAAFHSHLPNGQGIRQAILGPLVSRASWNSIIFFQALISQVCFSQSKTTSCKYLPEIG